ncbi:MAG: DUF1937 family protein [Bacillota bacterium]
MQPEHLPPLRREVAYVSGPYRAATPPGIWANIMRARDVAMDLWRMGYIAICPHLNTMLFDGIREDADWLAGDLEILRRCDLVVLVPGWRESAGARAEVEEARRRGIPVYEWGRGNSSSWGMRCMPKPRKWKRGRSKKARAGCLMCKPWKGNGMNWPDRQEMVWRAKA